MKMVFSFHLSSSLRLRRHFYPAAYADKALVGIYGNKKGMALLKVSIPYCVWRSTNLFLSLSVLHILRKQKSAKRLPCSCMVSSDTTYNHKQRMPRFSQKGSRNLPVAPEGILSPFPVYRLRIKINYGSILTQYLVSCQLEYTIYPASVSRFLHPKKFFSIFFKNFSSFCLLPYLYFIDQLFIVAGPPFFDN